MFKLFLIRRLSNKKKSSNLLFCKLQLKSVQTTAEVCADYTCSLYRLRWGFENRKGIVCFSFAYLETFGCKNKRLPDGLQNNKFYLSFCGALQNALIARHWDWRHREFTCVNDQAWISKITQRVPYYEMVSDKERVAWSLSWLLKTIQL